MKHHQQTKHLPMRRMGTAASLLALAPALAYSQTDEEPTERKTLAPLVVTSEEDTQAAIQEASASVDILTSQSLEDRDIRRIPDIFTARNNITYRHALDGGNAIMGMVEANVTGDYQFDQNNSGGQDAYTLVNARIGYEWTNSAVYLFAANLLVEAYLPSGYAAFPAGTYRGTPSAPQTFGVEFRANF